MRRGLLAFAAAFVLLALLPTLVRGAGLSLFYVVFLSTVFFWIAQATSWNILSGYSGYFSFGQAGFVGVGAYATAVLSGRDGIGYFATVPVAALLGGLLALVVGALAFRLGSIKGEIFALLTLAVPFILAAYIRLEPAIDGGQGIIVPIPNMPPGVAGFQDLVYLLDLAIAVAALAAAWAIERSRFGWGLSAIRDDEATAESLGVPTFRYKLLALALNGVIAGAAGSVLALQIGFVTVEGVFTLNTPLLVIVMAVLGGRRSWLGPLLGATLIVTLQDRLSAAGFEGWSLIVLGAILVGLMLMAPDGLVTRARARPLATVAAFAGTLVVLGGLAAAEVTSSGPIEWLLTALLVGSVVAFVPVPGRPSRSPQNRRIAVPMGGAEHAEGVGAATEPEIGPAPAALAPGAPAGDGAGPEPAPLVAVARVTKRFGGLQALRGVTVEVRAGEVLGLVGPNGSGKTTLINLVSGALPATSGEIRLGGSVIGGMAPHRIAHLGVARTHQIPRYFESMTVRDNVAMAVMFGPRGLAPAAARVEADRHLDFVGLGHLAAAEPAKVNLHERQLLEMARAIAAGPSVLLLDEALAGLNPAEIDGAVSVIRRIHRSGVAIVIVEHLLRVVNQLATRIVVLDGGAVIADGAPATVMADPAVVRAYLGARRAAGHAGSAPRDVPDRVPVAEAVATASADVDVAERAEPAEEGAADA